MSFNFLSRWLGPAKNVPVHGPSGRPHEKFPRAHMLAQPDFLPPADIADFLDFYRSRDPKLDARRLDHWNYSQVATFKWDVKTKDGAVTQASYLDTPLGDKLKATFEKTIRGFFPLVHQRIESLADQMHRILVVPLEYTLKAGQNLNQLLNWHQDEGLRYLGFLGVHMDPRIHGAQLELRKLHQMDAEQSFPTIPGQLLAFHNVEAEHRVSSVTVDNIDPETPAFRNVITLSLPG